MAQQPRKSRTQRLKRLKFIVYLLIAILAFYMVKVAISSKSRQVPDIPPAPIVATPPANAPSTSAALSADNLYSPYAILIDLANHAILMQKRSTARIYPASLTKIMCAIVAIENLPDLREPVKLPEVIFRELWSEDATMAGFLPGECVPVIDLLYGALLPSGAECCLGLARRIAGSEQGFVKLMNEKAVALGLNDTHFANVTGLHHPSHFSTVRDLADLLCYALQNEIFRKVFTAVRHSTASTNKHPGGITFYSTMFKKIGDPRFKDGVILGGKTGFTAEAGLCLASLAEYGGKEYVLVTAGAKGNRLTEQYNIRDALMVYSHLGK